jgi:hypothetical protein
MVNVPPAIVYPDALNVTDLAVIEVLSVTVVAVPAGKIASLPGELLQGASVPVALPLCHSWVVVFHIALPPLAAAATEGSKYKAVK